MYKNPLWKIWFLNQLMASRSMKKKMKFQTKLKRWMLMLTFSPYTFLFTFQAPFYLVWQKTFWKENGLPWKTSSGTSIDKDQLYMFCFIHESEKENANEGMHTRGEKEKLGMWWYSVLRLKRKCFHPWENRSQALSIMQKCGNGGDHGNDTLMRWSDAVIIMPNFGQKFEISFETAQMRLFTPLDTVNIVLKNILVRLFWKPLQVYRCKCNILLIWILISILQPVIGSNQVTKSSSTCTRS